MCSAAVYYYGSEHIVLRCTFCRSPYTWRTWVLLRWSVGDHRAAYALAQQGLKHDPKNLDMLYYSASCLQAMGFFTKAVSTSAVVLLLITPGPQGEPQETRMQD